ncbi:MAG: hypothetical protein KC800_30435, partial [Candidatus Eremiobacteraeota bacterium]|nr:hypothetical protein [Candidatus Eremiobacteraeota bacterium]
MPVSDENRQKWDRWLDRVSQIPDWSISLLEGSTYTPKQSAPKLRELVALLSGEPYSILREPYWNRGEWPEYLSTLNDRRKKAVELLREAER